MYGIDNFWSSNHVYLNYPVPGVMILMLTITLSVTWAHGLFWA
jgi:hypothetical protein